MDEHAPVAVQTPLLIDGHEPEGSVDYTPGIEHALDGYAPNSESWLAARDRFATELAEHGSVDAAARAALGSAEEDAESTYDEAETKFWNYVEGESGPHARYGAAINDALDNYAPDGESWLRARDGFFGAIRKGATVEYALESALRTVTEGAESSPDDASGRFWEDVRRIEQWERERGAAVESRNEWLQTYNPRISEVRASSGYGIEGVPVSEEREEGILAWHKRNKMLAIELAPPSREKELGIDMARIDRFLESKGLEPAPALVLTREEIKLYAERLAERGHGGQIPKELFEGGHHKSGGELAGVYMPDLGVVVVATDAADKLNLTEVGRRLYLEALLVHEKSHSSETMSEKEVVYTSGGGGHWSRRSGSTVQHLGRGGDGAEKVGTEGDFFEEGFAEMIAGEYVRDELGLPNGVWQNQPHPGLRADPMMSVVGGEHVWPGVYNGDYSFGTSAFAATGMKLLVRKRPELYEALVSSRNSVEGLRNVAKIVNSIEPGLYVKLRKLQYTSDGFRDALQTIQRAVR